MSCNTLINITIKTKLRAAPLLLLLLIASQLGKIKQFLRQPFLRHNIANCHGRLIKSGRYNFHDNITIGNNSHWRRNTIPVFHNNDITNMMLTHKFGCFLHRFIAMYNNDFPVTNFTNRHNNHLLI